MENMRKRPDHVKYDHVASATYTEQKCPSPMRRWIATLPSIIYTICFLCFLDRSINTALASTTKTEIYEPNTVVLSEEEIESQLIRSLNDLNYNEFGEEESISQKMSIDDVMSPEDQKIYMAEIYNLIVNSRKEQLVKPTKSTIYHTKANDNDSEDRIVKPTKSTLTSDEISNPMILEILQNIPDPELSTTLIEMIFPDDTSNGNGLQDMSIQEQLDIASRIANMIPGAKVDGKWIEIDYKDNDNSAAVLADFLGDHYLDEFGSETNPRDNASPFLTEEEQLDAIRKRAHQVIQDQVATAFANLEEGAQKVMDSQSKQKNIDKKLDSTNFFAKQSKLSRKKNARRKIDQFDSYLTPPCVDFHPKSCRWKKNKGYCRTTEHAEYMTEYCRSSCDLCNPSISDDICGVKQEFLTKDPKSGVYKPRAQLIRSKTDAEAPTETSKDVNNRIRNLISESDTYYTKGIMSTDVSKRALFSTCKNRHSFCALWAIQGVCETKPEIMAMTCGPACRLCHFQSNDNDVDDNGTEEGHVMGDEVGSHSGLSFATSPFIRGDLQGIFEAIEANRIVRGWNGITVAVSSNNSGEKGSWHRFVSLKQLSPIIYKQDDKQRYQKHRLAGDEPGAHPIHDNGPVIAQFNSFLNDEECEYLLSLVKFFRMEESKTDKDGFGAHTTDARIRENGKLQLIRTSARRYVLPYTDELDLNHHSPTDEVQHPIIEQIFDRIELVTGVPRSHIEVPIQFDKFIFNQFHEAQPHNVQQSIAEETLRKNLFQKNIKGKHIDNENFGFDHMKRNPRILGLTIFLNHDGLSGGEVKFPLLENIEISPMKGRAILYPMLTSLDELNEEAGTLNRSTPAHEKLLSMKMVMEGEEMKDKSWDDVALIAGAAFTAANAASDDDEPHKFKDLMRSDQTMISHLEVKDGKKYVVTFYLRLKSYLDDS